MIEPVTLMTSSRPKRGKTEYADLVKIGGDFSAVDTDFGEDAGIFTDAQIISFSVPLTPKIDNNLKNIVGVEYDGDTYAIFKKERSARDSVMFYGRLDS